MAAKSQLVPMDQLTVQIGRKGRNMVVAFPPRMTQSERKKAVSELFKMIRSVKEIR